MPGLRSAVGSAVEVGYVWEAAIKILMTGFGGNRFIQSPAPNARDHASDTLAVTPEAVLHS